MSDLISRQAAIDALDELCDRECEYSQQQRSIMCGACHLGSAFDVIEQLPPAQFDHIYTKRELKVFRSCISLRLLSLRSAQLWKHDDETASEIEFLNHLYEKVGADMEVEHDG